MRVIILFISVNHLFIPYSHINTQKCKNAGHICDITEESKTYAWEAEDPGDGVFQFLHMFRRGGGLEFFDDFELFKKSNDLIYCHIIAGEHQAFSFI